MGTVSSLLSSARYDLVDYETGLVFDDDELLIYLNRMIGLMDSTLASLMSDLVYTEETTIDTVASQAYVDISGMNSGLWSDVRDVWIGKIKLTGIPVELMYYERKFYSGDAFPYYWSLQDQNILFETGCSRGWSAVAVPTNATNILTAASAIEWRGAAASTADGPYWISDS
jgi:hypothetical protein